MAKNKNIRVDLQPEDPIELISNAINLHSEKAKIKEINIKMFDSLRFPLPKAVFIDQCKL